VWIGAQQAIDEAAAGKRTLVHATLKNLELLAEGGTVAAEYQDIYGDHAFDEHGNYIGPDYGTEGADGAAPAEAGDTGGTGDAPTGDAAAESGDAPASETGETEEA